jgi:hypothetical protein
VVRKAYKLYQLGGVVNENKKSPDLFTDNCIVGAVRRGYVVAKQLGSVVKEIEDVTRIVCLHAWWFTQGLRGAQGVQAVPAGRCSQ